MKFRCDICGRFISIKDLDAGKAYSVMSTPDSHFTVEKFETICKKCNEKEVKKWNMTYGKV